MYSYEDKMRAIGLYLRYDRSAAAVINELGAKCEIVEVAAQRVGYLHMASF